jgi:hypothetical protein
MWAYIDETGNTGNRIFDPDQPLFITAALVTKANFDLVWSSEISAIAAKAGVKALHANQLGMSKIEEIAPDLLRVVKNADGRFFLSRLEKRYLAAVKVFDTYFDAGENLAVPWSAYWIKTLRLTLVFKIATYLLDEEIAQCVWDSVTTPNDQKSRVAFLNAAQRMLVHVDDIPDARSRQIISDGLHWALQNPEAFPNPSRDKALRFMHAPNFVAFVSLMEGIDDISRRWDRPVREITHDEQLQFKKTLEVWHEAFTHPRLAGAKPLRWPGEPQPIYVGKVIGSHFTMKPENDSAGLQVIDIILWLFKRSLTDKPLGTNCSRLLNRALQRGRYTDFSFEGVGSAGDKMVTDLMAQSVSEDQEIKGREMMEKFEANRLKAMQDYATRKAVS